MVLTNAEITRITSELRQELLPVVMAQVREEVEAQVKQQLRMIEQREKAPRLLRIPEVCERVGFKSSKVWEMAKRGTFPQPVRLGPKVSAWREHEVTEWVQQHAV